MSSAADAAADVNHNGDPATTTTTVAASMSVDEYLERINSSTLRDNSVQNLFRLQQNHLLNVPFENLDIHLGRRVDVCDLAGIYHKVVLRKRGGLCCELNYLFYWLLKQLGYQVSLLACRAYRVQTSLWTPWFGHAALMVNMNQSNFLVDVGFSQNYRTPLRFVLNTIQLDVTGHYSISALDNNNDDDDEPEYHSNGNGNGTSNGNGNDNCNNNHTNDRNNSNNNNNTSTTYNINYGENDNDNNQKDEDDEQEEEKISEADGDDDEDTKVASAAATRQRKRQQQQQRRQRQQRPNSGGDHDIKTYLISKCVVKENVDNEEAWLPLYKFSTVPRSICDFRDMVDFVQSKKNPRLHDRSVCVIHTTYTVLNLVGHRLSEIKFANSTEKSKTHSMLTQSEVFDAIKNIYGIHLEDKQFEPKGEF